MKEKAGEESEKKKAGDREGFDVTLNRLEALVVKLEKGEMGLEESLAAFEEGMGLVRKAEKVLEEAEHKVELLVRGEKGEVRSEPLESRAGKPAEDEDEGEE